MHTSKVAAAIGLMSLAACSGGGADNTPPPTTTPPTSTAPASSASADLLAYIVDGGTVVYNQHSNENNLTRLQRSEVVDGVRHLAVTHKLVR